MGEKVMWKKCRCRCGNKSSGSAGPAFPLALAGLGERVRVTAIRGGAKLRERLLSIGVQAEDIVEVIQSRPQGAVLVAKGANRLMLGGGMAQKIYVIKE